METAKKHLQLIDAGTEVSTQEKAFLVHGARKFPINAECASKYSLHFRYADDNQLADSNQPVNLLIQNNADSLEVGPCRILTGSDLNGYTGRLVFCDNVYDIPCLLRDKKVVKLQSAFDDLEHIQERKSSIRSCFKEYTSDLVYDLSVYKKVFDDLDAHYRDEPEDVRESIQKAIINSEGHKFIRFFHEKVEELNHLVRGFNQKEHQAHGFYFRRQLWHIILCCALMARTNLKPRGYAGDSEMMKMIYLDDYRGDTTFCKLMQKYTVSVPAAQSVRNRRTLIMDMLQKFREKNHIRPPGKLRVLSVACGPAFEIADILVAPRDFDTYHFTLLDQDPRALKDADAFIYDIEKNSGARVQKEYLNMSVRLMLATAPPLNNLGTYHFIYSMGLFDYLSTPAAKGVIEKLYRMLAPGGEMVIGNFHLSNPSKYFMEYWGDWYLIHRTEDEFKNLLPETTAADISIIFENTGSQMFLDIKKPKNCP
ncbi:MAG: class I SAM-dependent methyltransferase [Desulfobacterales bacterium]|nr:MAG: class I SAM-dependent methyltransferase [Desulfobacterales bacterium]